MPYLAPRFHSLPFLLGKVPFAVEIDQAAGQNPPSEVPMEGDQAHKKRNREENPVGVGDETEYALLNVQIGPVRSFRRWFDLQNLRLFLIASPMLR